MRFFWVMIAATLCGQTPARLDPAQQENILWNDIKRELVSLRGTEYFEKSVKDSAVPPFHGTIVSITQAQPGPVWLVRIDGQSEPEVRLKLRENPVSPVFRVGDKIRFEGIARECVQQSFMITIDAKMVGVPSPR